MNNHIGLAFLTENISFAHFIQREKLELDHLGTIEYPFNYQEDIFFRNENIATLAHLLRSSFDTLQIPLLNVSISIESNLAKLHRILLPNNIDIDKENDHINWDLGESLSLPLENYVYLRTDNQLNYQTEKDILIVAIQKKVINFYKELVDFGKLKLSNLSVHQLAAELSYQRSCEQEQNEIVLLVKIGKNHIEGTFILNGNYYTSNYKRIYSSSSTLSFEQSVVDMIKTELKNFENLIEIHGKEPNTVNKIFVYGQTINQELIDVISNNLSIPVIRLNPLQNVTLSENFKQNLPDEDSSKYVECIGITFDI
jgi:Tfp pilus assembly PilM family ATPase